MKNQFARHNRGFTLVELLVVIAIIAVLAAVGIPAALSAIQKGKKVTCLASCTALESAVNNFFTEYGNLPTDAVTDIVVETDKDRELITVLSGLPETSTPPKNPRGMKILQVKEAKNKKKMDGMLYSPDGKSVVGLYDPWGGGYKVMLDGDYDDRLTVSVSGRTTNLNGRRVAAWSLGADGVKDPTRSKPGDDVTTW